MESKSEVPLKSTGLFYDITSRQWKATLKLPRLAIVISLMTMMELTRSPIQRIQ